MPFNPKSRVHFVVKQHMRELEAKEAVQAASQVAAPPVQIMDVPAPVDIMHVVVPVPEVEKVVEVVERVVEVEKVVERVVEVEKLVEKPALDLLAECEKLVKNKSNAPSAPGAPKPQKKRPNNLS